MFTVLQNLLTDLEIHNTTFKFSVYMYIVQYRFMMQVLFYVDLTICESSKCLSLVMEIS